MKLQTLSLLVLTLVLGISTTTRADIVISNLGNSVNGGALLNGANQVAFKFEMGPTSLTFENAILTLENIGAVLPVPVVTLKEGDSLDPPAAGIALTNTTAPGLGRMDYTFIAPPGTTLDAGTNYWIQVSGFLSWENTATAPSGAFATNQGYRVTNDGGANWSDYSSFNPLVQINAVPEPTSTISMMLVFGMVGLRRKRANV